MSTTNTLPRVSPYVPRTWNLSGLQGISDKTLQTHFGLYEGYVKNTNLLDEQIATMIGAGEASASNLAFAELTRRLGFETNGMRLHEYYFDNMTAQPATSRKTPRFEGAATSVYGSYKNWETDFVAIGTMRGVGWAIAYYDVKAARLRNHWITLHEEGDISGLIPVLVMDVWEHAWLLDYKPAERPKYIEAFFNHIDWSMVEQRLKDAGVAT
jgi:Fe-Mn family superoxide dismutase